MGKWIDEVSGVYKNHRYVVKFQEMGHRCGYIEVLQDECIDDAYIEAYGGITFRDVVTPDDSTEYLPVGSWVGFDCAHWGDAVDVDSCIEYFGEPPKYVNTFCDPGSHVRSKEYCVAECTSVIDQIIEHNASDN